MTTPRRIPCIYARSFARFSEWGLLNDVHQRCDMNVTCKGVYWTAPCCTRLLWLERPVHREKGTSINIEGCDSWRMKEEKKALNIERGSRDSRSTDCDCCTFAPKIVGELLMNAISRNYEITNKSRAFLCAQKNSCRTCFYEVKCRRALWLQECESLWSNCKRTQSSELRFFL